MASDSAIIRRCLNADQEAWSHLIAKYQRLIYSVARTYCREREDASDIFQQVCLELYQRLPDLRSTETLPAWLITVTRRRAYAFLQARNHDTELPEEMPETERRIEQIEKEHAIERALDQVSSRCRDLLNLLYFDAAGPSYTEIAAKIRIPVASIGPTRARCLEKMKKFLS
jgi:RNA polymerase sigma factor (sigma-70 family)